MLKKSSNRFADLTKRQQAVFDYMRELIQRRGYGPTVREIATHFEIKSPNGVMCHLRALERKGLIRRDPNKARAIELLRSSGAQAAGERRGMSFAGVVPAGFTSHAFELNERIDFEALFQGKNLFVLRVQGDSMIDAHIAEGDYVICRSCDSAEKGQMVVALNEENEATLKYWHPERNRIRLQPANASMPPIYVKRATVRGVVVGLVRSRL